ncbi:DUF885 domain-containing protein [Amycolatopsis cihanbeyliensis]|uniref:Uncharacterized protein (DUF885 family) n=1 Tax=Amycolatopsis cihanbeyliensis TaxID=1128664 RepID=A0A542DG98_AMYCI|nr:DUF885 domain-containing protein [Amycolatopsis cihanbeyliensis]TQJ02061.1 uncharacterized protein (DUF885 family) [Amycolatopsis cihanbeyliensis]
MASTEGVHEICNRYVDDFAAAHPVAATEFGISGYEDQLTDYSPEGHAARAALAKRYLREIDQVEPTDASERLAKTVFTERVGIGLEIHEAGLDLGALNVTDSPVQALRTIFDLMPVDTADQWEQIGARLAGIPTALDGVRASLLAAADADQAPALRQVSKVAEQAETWAGLHGGSGFFDDLVRGAESADLPESLRTRLRHGAQVAQEAYAELAGFLRAELAPRVPTKDAVGAEVYRLWSRNFVGAELDLREAYEWGWAEFARVEREAKDVAERIKPGASLAQAAAALDADPRYRVQGQRGLEEWMQRLSDHALESLRGKHFDIPDAVMALECKIAPPGGGVGAYYTGPTEDFSRPGQMWWSVPPSREEFSTWREVSTVYHEGAPGHHLQIATSVYQAATLNRFQRMLALTSGHAEGWALYAERLMQDLGFLEDDGNLLGMLDAHLFRAARVVVDIGMHLELEIPAGTGFHEGERWTPELGLEFMLTRTITDADHVRDEIDRYLGWPGQAPSYKLGERMWLAAREDTRRRMGSAFDLKDFHTRALRLGGMGLDTLKETLADLG